MDTQLTDVFRLVKKSTAVKIPYNKYCTSYKTVITQNVMKQYVIDELRFKDYEKIKDYFDKHFGATEIGGIYSVHLDQEILTETQISHSECKPFYFAIELEPEKISCEFLVRTENKIRCSCIKYATETQRNWFIRLIDSILGKLEISV